MHLRTRRAIGTAICVAMTSHAAGQDLLVSSRFSNNVLRYDSADGTFVEVFADGGAMANPNGIAMGPDGHLYVAMGDLGRVGRYDWRTGTPLGDFVFDDPGTPEDENRGLQSVRDITFGPDGDLYVASPSTHEVLVFDGASGALIRSLSGGGLTVPLGLAFGPDGLLYVGAGLSNTIYRFDVGTGDALGPFASSAQLSNPTDLAFDPGGILHVGSGVNSNVVRFDPDGNFLGVFIQGLELQTAIGLLFHPDGTLLVSSFDNDSVLRYDAVTGDLVETLVTSGAGGLNGTHWMVLLPCPADVDRDGEIGILDFLAVLADWGPCPDPCLSDIDGDGEVGVLDFLDVLAAWGDCFN